MKRFLAIGVAVLALGSGGFIAAAAIVVEEHPYTKGYTDYVTINSKGKVSVFTVSGSVSGTITDTDTIPDPVTVTQTVTPPGTTTAPPANRNPVACASYGPVPVYVGATTTFSAACSTDPDGDSLTYEWDIVWPAGEFERSGITATYAYQSAGSKSFTLRVSDGRGGVNTATATLDAVNPPATTSVTTTQPPATTTSPPTSTGEIKANIWVVPNG